MVESRSGTDQLAEAAETLRADPARADMWHRVGFLLLERGRWTEALPYLTQAVHRDAQSRIYTLHLALAEMETGVLDQAAMRMATLITPDSMDAETWLITAEILCRAAQYETARACFERATHNPALRHSSLLGCAYTTFMTGHFDEALQPLADSDAVTDDLPLPLWQGDKSQNIILVGEYGYGDLIHYLRYAREVRAMLRPDGGTVVLSLPEAIAALVATSFDEFTIYVRDEITPDHPALRFPNVTTTLPGNLNAKLFYLQAIPYLGAFHTACETIPYMRADAAHSALWQQRTTSIDKPRIGIVWAGNPRHRNDHNRSIPPELLRPLVDVAGPHLISLQRGGDAAMLGIHDAAPMIGNFSDSAALMATLDLLITIDSAPAHLAGALGIPAWVLLPFDHDWRWLMGREDCIWYPHTRLYRQTAPQDWAGVIARVTKDIRALCAGDRGVLQPARQPLTPNLTHHPLAVQTPAIQSLLQQIKLALKLAHHREQ